MGFAGTVAYRTWGTLWAAIGICPLAANRRCPLTAISPRSVLAAGDTTALRCCPRPALRGRVNPRVASALWDGVIFVGMRPEPSLWSVFGCLESGSHSGYETCGSGPHPKSINHPIRVIVGGSTRQLCNWPGS